MEEDTVAESDTRSQYTAVQQHTNHESPPLSLLLRYQEYLYMVDSYAHRIQEHHPSFDFPTQGVNEIYSPDGSKVCLWPLASLSKGFFKVDEQWTCYRRNYFSVSCAFVMNPRVDGPVYLRRDRQLCQIAQFAAKPSTLPSHGAPETQELIQHTPKRDKASETTPVPMELRPLNNSFYSAGSSLPQEFHTYERVQFKKATANNGKRRQQQQYYHIIVELLAKTLDSPKEWVQIAKCTSVPLVIRGRSPGHYKDNEPNESYRDSVRQDTDEWRQPADLKGPTTSKDPNSDEGFGSRPQLPGNTANEALGQAESTESYTQAPRKGLISMYSNDPESSEPSPLISEPSLRLQSRTTGTSLGTLDSDQYDNDSISSVSDTFSLAADQTSRTSVSSLREPLDDFVDIILDDDGMRCLFTDGFQLLDSTRFERNVKRLLKQYSQELSTQASRELEIRAATFVRSKINKIAKYIRIQMRQQEYGLHRPFEYRIFSNTGDVLLQEIIPDQSNEIIFSAVPKHAENLQSMKSFLVSSDAFENLREGLMDYVVPFVQHARSNSATTNQAGPFSVVALQGRYQQSRHMKQEITTDEAQLRPRPSVLKGSTKNFGILFQQWNFFWSRLFRADPPMGYRRLEWVCDCGELLWGDFKNEPHGIKRCNPLSSELPVLSSNSVSQPSFNFSSTSTSQALSSGNSLEAAVGPQSSSPHRVLVPNRYTSVNTNRSFQEKYLELCINLGEYEIGLREIKISTSDACINSDGQLFGEIRNTYNNVRGAFKAHRLGLFKPVQVNFVQFCLEDGAVGVLKTPSALPSDAEVISKQWEFCACPCPLNDPPPIPNNVFLHLLTSKRHHPRNTWMNRLPKKLNSSIYSSTNSQHPGWQAVGWGVHIVEGPNGKAMMWLTVVTCLISFIFAVLWSVVKGDTQGAFGIGSFLVAFQTALAFAFFNYYPLHRVSKQHVD